MADTTTELEVLDEIVDVLGGQSGQHKTVVPVLEDIRDLLGGGGGGGGYNPSLSVGRADALTGADSTAQWAQRVTAGSGAATVRSVKGATVAFNQCVRNGNFDDTSYWQASNAGFSVSDNTLSMQATGQNGRVTTDATVNAKNGDKILIKCAVNPTSNASIRFGSYFSSSYNKQFNVEAGWQEIANIFAVVANYVSLTVGVTDMRTEGFDQIQVRDVMTFNLTTMFGSGNEPSTVAEFEAMYPAPYYPYSAPTLKPVRIAGIASTDANGDALDGVEWPTQTLRAAGSARDELTAGELVTRVGVVDLGTLVWTMNTSPAFFSAVIPTKANPVTSMPNAECAALQPVTFNDMYKNFATIADDSFAISNGSNSRVYVKKTSVANAAALATALSGVPLYYELATPTTTPISPALPMTYRVEQGGTENIIVPSGEVSAAPVLTVAEGESAADVVMDALACIAAPDGPTATSNHAVNTYLTMQGKLYKVTSAIAVGETITAGTNVTETTVMAEILALN